MCPRPDPWWTGLVDSWLPVCPVEIAQVALGVGLPSEGVGSGEADGGGGCEGRTPPQYLGEPLRVEPGLSHP